MNMVTVSFSPKQLNILMIAVEFILEHKLGNSQSQDECTELRDLLRAARDVEPLQN